jgi:hypothetical protein
MKTGVHECGCGTCRRGGFNSTRELHAQLNAFLSTLDEDKRLEFLGLESMTASYGGDQALELITGVKATVIAKARWGMQQSRMADQVLGRTTSFYYEKKPLTTVTRYQTKAKQNGRGGGS